MAVLPESDFIRKEIVVRSMLLPKDTKMTRASLIRWFALSTGLISPKETRTSLIPVLESIFHYQYEKYADPNVEEIVSRSKTHEKTVYYHLLQLQKAGIIERVKDSYRFTSSPFGEERDIAESLQYQYEKELKEAMEKIKEAVKLLKR